MARTHYADVTIKDRNIIKRKLHRIRYKHAIIPLKKYPHNFSGNILDYGGGNGQLCRYISSILPYSNITMYEPSPDIRSEAISNLEDYPKIRIKDNVNDIASNSFDVIFCLAVFEHIPGRKYIIFFNDFKRLLKQNGKIIIGIPIEIYIPALAKGLFRMSRRYKEYDANLYNVFRCVIGRPPRNRPLSKLSDSLPYHWDHLGFDHRILQKKLSRHFKIIKKYGSPFPLLLDFLNFDRYYICTK